MHIELSYGGIVVWALYFFGGLLAYYAVSVLLLKPMIINQIKVHPEKRICNRTSGPCWEIRLNRRKYSHEDVLGCVRSVAILKSFLWPVLVFFLISSVMAHKVFSQLEEDQKRLRELELQKKELSRKVALAKAEMDMPFGVKWQAVFNQLEEESRV